jgi:hypothetical protein
MGDVYGLPRTLTKEEIRIIGAKMQATADALPTLKPKGFSLLIGVILFVLVILSTLVMAFRTYARFAPIFLKSSRGWGWDDTIALVSYVSSRLFRKILLVRQVDSNVLSSYSYSLLLAGASLSTLASSVSALFPQTLRTSFGAPSIAGLARLQTS